MNRKSVGLVMIVSGLIMALVGLAGWIFSGNDASGETSTTIAASTTSLPTTLPETSTSTTTSEPATTTTMPSTTTTTIDASGSIQGFVPAFADAIAREDVDFLIATLHPSVLALFDEESCRTFITEEILELEQYRLIGEIAGPTTQLVGGMEVDMYQGAVAFAFRGQEFTSEAAFAFVDGQTRWFTQCGSG